MRKLPGGTLRAHIAAVWEAAQGELSPQALRGLLQILLRVCEAMALAHDTGMLHRDLNPTQVLLGNYGEAVVLDWGLVGMVGEACVGWTVAGMSPEQARGEPLDARADVYALGMILLEILEGRVPWSAERESWLDHIRSGRVPEPQRGPEPLQALCRACLAPEPAARPPDARALARRLSDYLEDALREEDARAQLQHALALEPEIAAIQAHITELWQRTAAERSRLLPWSSEQEHARLWALEDQIRAARLRRTEQRLAQEELLQIGRERSPGLPELLDQLAILYRERFEDAEKALDEEGVLRAQRRLVGVDRQGLHRAWLARPCELHISTDPPALMEIFRYEERGRRLVPCLVTGASSPWTGSLKPGSYLIKIQVPSGCVQLPLLLERGQDPRFVHLPLPPLGPEDCLVAAGPYAEGDEQAPEGLPERIRTLPTFVVRKFPMRVREYFDFLNGLIAEGRMEEAELHAPFSEFAGFGSPGGPC
ncbi:MAG TPA: protein kinase, partial [Myxococcota bacterium]|nr:protein kinase [Myxococcota bacterium]